MKDHVYISIGRFENLIRENSTLRSKNLVADAMVNQLEENVDKLKGKILSLEATLGKTFKDREQYRDWWNSESEKRKGLEKELEALRTTEKKEAEPCQTPAG